MYLFYNFFKNLFHQWILIDDRIEIKSINIVLFINKNITFAILITWQVLIFKINLQQKQIKIQQ